MIFMTLSFCQKEFMAWENLSLIFPFTPCVQQIGAYPEGTLKPVVLNFVLVKGTLQ